MNLAQALEIVKEHIRIGKGMELTNQVPEALEMVKAAFAELEQYERALELACSHLAGTNSGEYCPADYITHDGALCAEKQPCSGKEKECWGEHFLSQAKDGDSNA